MKSQYGDVSVTLLDNHVAICEIKRGPNNFFDQDLIRDLADAFVDIDADVNARAIGPISRNEEGRNPLYVEAVRLFRSKTPVIAAVQGAAVGGGFGLAVMADFRVLCPDTRLTANFVKLGFTPGFGLTHTLARIIGHQKANLLFFTGRRITGETAMEWGLGDVFTDRDNIREAAIDLAAEIAENAPLAVVSVREQVRGDLADAVQAATDIEGREQAILQKTNDHKEGVRAVAERRPGQFTAT